MTTREVGSRAEALAARFLEREGYCIVTRNYRVRSGEIDLVAREGRVLCFVEVRSRAHDRHGAPEETISRGKRRRIAAAAAHYLATHGGDVECRFDVVSVTGAGGAMLLRDAFRLEDC